MTDANIEAVHRKTRQRLLFTGIHLVLYFSFTLNWTSCLLFSFLRLFCSRLFFSCCLAGRPDNAAVGG